MEADAQGVATFRLGEDIEEDRQEVKHKVRNKKDQGKELFNPDTFKEAQPSLKVAEHKLSESEVIAYGQLTTDLRAAIKARSESLREGQDAGSDGSEEERKDH